MRGSPHPLSEPRRGARASTGPHPPSRSPIDLSATVIPEAAFVNHKHGGAAIDGPLHLVAGSGEILVSRSATAARGLIRRGIEA